MSISVAGNEPLYLTGIVHVNGTGTTGGRREEVEELEEKISVHVCVGS